MSDRPWWAYVLQYGTFIIVMVIVMKLYERSRLRIRRANGLTLLVYPVGALTMGALGFFLFGGITVAALLLQDKNGHPLYTLFFFALTFYCIYWILECLYLRHNLESNGISYRTLLSGQGFLDWQNVARIRYSGICKWIRIDGAQGEVVRVSMMLTSLPEFARSVLQAVPQQRIDTSAYSVLEGTADGNPPRLW